MSKILSMSLSNKGTKPIFTTATPSNKQIKCMLDTGADMPVWCGSEGLLKIVFPKTERIDKKFLLSGFGRKPDMTIEEKLLYYNTPRSDAEEQIERLRDKRAVKI